MQCSNNLKQMGLAFHNHHSQHGHFPAGGWGHRWVGDAERGFGADQPGGWMYNCLPFLEQEALYQLGANLTGTAKLDAHRTRNSTPLAVFICPSRRRAMAYPYKLSHSPYNASTSDGDVVGKSDYASNGGHVFTVAEPDNPGPPSLDDAKLPEWVAGFANVKSLANGIVFSGSTVMIADVRDGTSNTYMVGEKYLRPEDYTVGDGGGDNESLYIGDNEDISRWTYELPYQDRPGSYSKRRFGSAHPGGWNVVLCDGSVRSISYSIAADIHRRLGNRKDGEPVDPSKL